MMTRITRAALIQASNDTPGEASIDEIKSIRTWMEGLLMEV